MPDPTLPNGSRASLGELAQVFLKLGTIAFGGPAAHVGMMEEEVVRRRGWLTREQFLDYLGAANLIPGPNSTELAIFVGRDQAGMPGLIVAGACFILPAALIVGAMAWGYVRFGALPAVGALLYGVKPVIIAIVLQALWHLGRTALRTALLVGVALGAVVATVAGVHELVVLALAGTAAAISRRGRASDTARAAGALAPLGLSSVAATAAATAPAAISVSGIFGAFVKIGAVLFGSGYVLLAFLRADLVERLGWLTERQLLDAVVVGQVTPGPVFTTATFIGYLLAGTRGAVAATAGIFLPAFVFVAVSGPVIPRLRRSPTASAALDGVIAASLALMAVVTWQLARAALVDVPTIGIAALGSVLLLRYRVGSAWLIAGGAVVGLVAAAVASR